MIVENIDAFYTWLTSCLGKLSDADPAALAKYVMALVKKDKSENDLKIFCLDQLDVFLMSETKGFVDILFEALRTKAYLPSEASESIATAAFEEAATRSTGDVEKDLLDTRISKEKQSDSQSSDNTEENSRVVEEKRHMQISELERYRPSGKEKGSCRYERHLESDRLGRLPPSSRQRIHRSRENTSRRYRSRSPLKRTGKNRQAGSRSSSTTSSRSNEDYSECNHSDPKKHNRNNTLDHVPDRGDSDYRIIMHSKMARHATARRCKDYDEKGYCMQGDQCHYDHGADPFVVNDVSTLSFTGGANTTTTTTTTAASSSCPTTAIPASVSTAVVDEGGTASSVLLHQHVLSESLPPLPSSPPPLPPPPPMSLPPGKSFAPEPYNPEAPGIYCAKNDTIPPWATMPHPEHSLPGPLPSSIYLPAYNPNEPPPSFHAKSQRTRELIGVPLAMDIDESRKSSVGGTGLSHDIQSLGLTGNEEEKTFDYNRLGRKQKVWTNSPKFPADRKKRNVLEIRRIPRHLNSILTLGQHFSRFGPINAIRTFFNNDPEAAIVEFANFASANAAYRSSEPVLNNRFIKVFWNKMDGNGASTPIPLEIGNANEGKISVSLESASDKTVIATSTVKKVFPESNKCLRQAVCFNPASLRKSNICPSIVASSLKTKNEQRKEALFSRKLNLNKKKTEMISNLLQNQKMLLQKLSMTKNEKVREGLKKMLDEVETRTGALQEELKRDIQEIKTCHSKTSVAHVEIAKKSDTEKQLLDAEMDLYNKEYKGDDVTDLMCRVSVLKEKTFNLVRGKSEREFQLGRPVPSWGRLTQPRARSTFFSLDAVGRSVDHRPRKILVTANPTLDEEAVRSKFQQYGMIQSSETTAAGTFITYRSRREAETAMQLGSKNVQASQGIISVFWAPDCGTQQPVNASVAANSLIAESSSVEEMVVKDESPELLEEEEEEEDSEARSWRR